MLNSQPTDTRKLLQATINVFANYQRDGVFGRTCVCSPRPCSQELHVGVARATVVLYFNPLFPSGLI